MLLPADADGSLLVLIVDNTGWAILRTLGEDGLEGVGDVRGGVRRVRVLHSRAAWCEDKTVNASVIDTKDWGKVEVIAILSETPLFTVDGPHKGQSVESLEEELGPVLAERQNEILGAAARIIDARE